MKLPACTQNACQEGRSECPNRALCELEESTGIIWLLLWPLLIAGGVACFFVGVASGWW